MTIDTKAILGKSLTWGRRLWDAALADIALELTGKAIGMNIPRPGKPASDEDGEIKPLFGLAGLTPKNERAFRRILLRQPHDVKMNVIWAILEYYIAPSKLGFVPDKIAGHHLDKFMLEVAEAAKDGHKYGQRQIVMTVEKKTKSSTTSTVTTSDEELLTPRGEEDDELLAAIAETFSIGGLPALDEFIRVNRLPRMDHKALKKTQERIDSLSGSLSGVIEKIFGFSKKNILNDIPAASQKINKAVIDRSDRIDARKWYHPLRMFGW